MADGEKIVSPFYPQGEGFRVTTEHLEKIKEMLGVESVFIAVQIKKHEECTPETCKGHLIGAGSSGFTVEQIIGLLEMITTHPPTQL